VSDFASHKSVCADLRKPFRTDRIARSRASTCGCVRKSEEQMKIETASARRAMATSGELRACARAVAGVVARSPVVIMRSMKASPDGKTACAASARGARATGSDDARPAVDLGACPARHPLYRSRCTVRRYPPRCLPGKKKGRPKAALFPGGREDFDQSSSSSNSA